MPTGNAHKNHVLLSKLCLGNIIMLEYILAILSKQYFNSIYIFFEYRHPQKPRDSHLAGRKNDVKGAFVVPFPLPLTDDQAFSQKLKVSRPRSMFLVNFLKD